MSGAAKIAARTRRTILRVWVEIPASWGGEAQAKSDSLFEALDAAGVPVASNSALSIAGELLIVLVPKSGKSTLQGKPIDADAADVKTILRVFWDFKLDRLYLDKPKAGT